MGEAVLLHIRIADLKVGLASCDLNKLTNDILSKSTILNSCVQGMSPSLQKFTTQPFEACSRQWASAQERILYKHIGRKWRIDFHALTKCVRNVACATDVCTIEIEVNPNCRVHCCQLTNHWIRTSIEDKRTGYRCKKMTENSTCSPLLRCIHELLKKPVCIPKRIAITFGADLQLRSTHPCRPSGAINRRAEVIAGYILSKM